MQLPPDGLHESERVVVSEPRGWRLAIRGRRLHAIRQVSDEASVIEGKVRPLAPLQRNVSPVCVIDQVACDAQDSKSAPSVAPGLNCAYGFNRATGYQTVPSLSRSK